MMITASSLPSPHASLRTCFLILALLSRSLEQAIHYITAYTTDFVVKNKMADAVKELRESLSNFVNDSVFSLFFPR